MFNNVSILSWDLYPRQRACLGETLPLPAALEFHSKASMYVYHRLLGCNKLEDVFVHLGKGAAG